VRVERRHPFRNESVSIEDIFPSPRECLSLLPLYYAIVALILVPLWLKDQARLDWPAAYEVAPADGGDFQFRADGQGEKLR